ncbi:MAG: S9 family peptidase [Acidobacteriota bacterium]|nr:S9 family peptidase [Acidobacteriota bacterium]
MKPVLSSLPSVLLRFALSALALGVLLSAPTEAARLDEPVLGLDVIFGDDASGRSPRSMTWASDGKRLAYLWKEEEEDALWVLDVESDERKRVLALGETGDHPISSISGLHWSPDGSSILAVSSGDLHLIDIGSSQVKRLTETVAKEEDPKFSPDGKHLAFVREYNLFLMELAGGDERALTTDGRKNEILNGTTNWVYWEEIWGRSATGYWWHPDGTHIAYYRFDDRHVKTYPLVDFTTQYPTVERQKYPKAGEDNPLVRVGVLELESGETTWMETDDSGINDADNSADEISDVYLARVDWRPSGDRVAIQRLNREQDHLDLLLCDPASGTCSTLLTETSGTWVNLTKDLRFLPDNRFVWTSEKSGWNRVGLYSATGELLRNLTPDGWTVTQIDSLFVTDDESAVFYTAHRTERLGALYRIVFRQTISGGTPRRLGSESAWHQAQIAPASGNLVLSKSGANRPTVRVVLDKLGREIASLPRKPPSYHPEALPAWEFLSIPGPNEQPLPAAILKPAGLDATRKYPAVMYHYGGPASQVVADRWSGARNLWHKMMAQRDYVVLMVDNAGSNFFGKQGADLLHRRFGEINLAAQRAGVEYLGRLPYVDTERIGLWGWSGGGSNTLYSLLNSPGTWKAGVSGAPVTDWHFYDTIWTERYLDHPEDNPDGYRDSSAITHANKLEDRLLIVHGTADDNVHPQNTIAMARKLIDAGIPFEDAIYPRQKHGFRGVDTRHFYGRMTEFFDQHLGGDELRAPQVAAGAEPQG